MAALFIVRFRESVDSQFKTSMNETHRLTTELLLRLPSRPYGVADE